MVVMRITFELDGKTCYADYNFTKETEDEYDEAIMLAWKNAAWFLMKDKCLGWQRDREIH